jgi:hypothetical protein
VAEDKKEVGGKHSLFSIAFQRAGMGDRQNIMYQNDAFRISNAYDAPENRYRQGLSYVVATESVLYTILCNRLPNKDLDLKTRDDVQNYMLTKRNFIEKLRDGPGTAYLIYRTKDTKPVILYSDVGYKQLKIIEEVRNPEDGLRQVITPNFELDILICPDYKRSNKDCIINYRDMYGYSTMSRDHCMRCREKKGWECQLREEGDEFGDHNWFQTDTSEFPGLDARLYYNLSTITMNQLDQLFDDWDRMVQVYIGSDVTKIPVPEFFAEGVGKYMKPPDDYMEKLKGSGGY